MKERRLSLFFYNDYLCGSGLLSNSALGLNNNEMQYKPASPTIA